MGKIVYDSGTGSNENAIDALQFRMCDHSLGCLLPLLNGGQSMKIVEFVDGGDRSACISSFQRRGIRDLEDMAGSRVIEI
jgi:hypothetical protein